MGGHRPKDFKSVQKNVTKRCQREGKCCTLAKAIPEIGDHFRSETIQICEYYKVIKGKNMKQSYLEIIKPNGNWRNIGKCARSNCSDIFDVFAESCDPRESTNIQ